MPTNPATGRAIGASGSQVQVGGLDDGGDHQGGASFDPREELAAARREAIYTARADWSQLARLHTAQVDSAADATERARALCRAAAVYRIHLGDVAAALPLLGRALADCPDDPEVAADLEAAARVSADAAAEVRALCAGAAVGLELSAPDLAAELWLRAALIDAAVRGDIASATDAIGRVGGVAARMAGLLERIERSAGSVGLLDTLALLCRRAGDGAREKRVLLRSLDLAADRGDCAARHRAIAALARAEGDADSAGWHEREADELERLARVQMIAGEPAGAGGASPPFRVPGPDAFDHDRATAALADRAWRERRWHALEPLVDRLLRSDGAGATVDDDQPSPVELHYRAGRAALELGKFDKACRHYHEALAFDQVHLPALLEHAMAAAELERWDQAHELCGAALLVQRSLGRPDAELAETLYRMGEARARGGGAAARAEAQTLYASALDVHPAHRRALDAACRAHREAGDLRSVERLLRAALPRASRRRRTGLMVELAGLESRFLGDPGAAVALIRQALTQAPGERHLLIALVEHCQAAGRWREAVDAVTQLAEQEGSALRRGRYHQLASGLAMSLSTAPVEAIAHLERALDCYFGAGGPPSDRARVRCLGAFREIEGILRARADWRGLERAYRAMIARLEASAPERAGLMAELGQLRAEPLGQPAAPSSIPSSAPVAAAAPASTPAAGPSSTPAAALIDLHQGVAPDELDKLIERRRKLIAAEPFQAEHYSALRSLFVKSKNRDGTFCACRALAFLDRADRQEKDFYRAHRPDRVTWPSRGLAGADWRRLRHPGEDPLVSAVFALSAERVALSMSTTARRLRLRDDASASLDNVRHLFRSACTALGVAEPDLFLAPGVESDVVLANLRRGPSLAPAFVVGRHMYQGRTGGQMVQSMARALSYARPHAYLRLLLGPSSRVAAAFAAACVVGGEANDGAAADDVAEIAEAIRPPRSDAVWLAELRGAVRRLRERGSEVEVGRFCRALDATARRAGLLFGGALDVAAADLHREPMFARSRPRNERLADLLVHSVSEEHLALRRDLRLGLQD